MLHGMLVVPGLEPGDAPGRALGLRQLLRATRLVRGHRGGGRRGLPAAAPGAVLQALGAGEALGDEANGHVHEVGGRGESERQ